MKRFAYGVITNKGRALDVLFRRLKLAMDPKQKGSDEEKSLKTVSLVHRSRLGTIRTNESDSIIDDHVPQHD